jgi:hypothetical protein
VGIENNNIRSFKDLEEMLGNAKALKRNNRKYKEILIGPSMAPRFSRSLIFPGGGFPAHCPSKESRLGQKFCGTDGKPTIKTLASLQRKDIQGITRHPLER